MGMIYTKVSNKYKQKKKPGWKQREAEYQKHLKKLGLDKPAKKKTQEFKPLVTEPSVHSIRTERHRQMYPSVDCTQASTNACAKKERQTYTGTLITGIATMHKSNAVPVINQKQAEEISKMGR